VTIEATDPANIQFSYLTKFESEIRRFDMVMDLIQEFMPNDCKVWDRIAVVRDAVFKLQQQLRGVEIEVFAAPWIDLEDIGFPYKSPGDIFWDRRKEEDVEYYAEGEDPTKREDEEV
jgi:hypothetical protein